jgi:succinyl-diaminopimelate desuccinylase
MVEKIVQSPQPLTPEEEHLLRKVDEKRDELIQLLQQLIKFESRQYDPFTYNNVDEIFKFVADYMKQLEIPTQNYPCKFPYDGPKGEQGLTYPNLIAKMTGNQPGPTLQFMGHLDVVPYTPEKWDPDIAPLSGLIKNNRIYGRGAADMKGGVAGQMMAMKILKDANIPIKGSLQMYFTPDEEIDGPYGARFMAENHLDAINADATIISEPTGQSPLQSPALILGEKGCQWYRLRFYGAAGHGSMPKKKSNAINKALKFMSNVKKLKLPQVKPPLNLKYMVKSLLSRYTFKNLLAILSDTGEAEPDPRDEDGYALGVFFNTTISFNQIKAGTKVNVIPDICDLEIDIRILPGISTQQVLDALVNYAAKIGYRMELPSKFTNCQQMNAKIQKRPIDIEVFPIATALGTFERIDSPFVQLMGDSFEAIYNRSRVFFFAPGSTDGTHLRNQGVKNVVVFGPGGGNTHSANEFVEIEQLVQCTKVFLLTAYRFLKN